MNQFKARFHFFLSNYPGLNSYVDKKKSMQNSIKKQQQKSNTYTDRNRN